MIKAIIFDCFGVLATDGWLPFKRKYFGGDQKLWDEASDLNKRAETGHMSYDEYIKAIADLAGVTEQLARHYIEHNVPDETLFDYIATLKLKYKLGILSNAGKNWLPEIFTEDQIALFDEIALSFKTGHVKPEPQAYQHIAGLLNAKLDECVFIDDQERYVTAARGLGMQAIVYSGYEQMKKQLVELLKEG